VSTPQTPVRTRAAPSRRRWLVRTLLLLAPVLLVTGLYLYLYLSAEWAYQEAVAEVDRLEPDGWQLPDLEARRATLPEDQNAALPVLAAARLTPGWWASSQQFVHRFIDEHPPPEVQLNEQQTALLRAEVQRATAAVAETRKLADLPEGRYPVAWAPDFISTPLDHAQQARNAAALLAYDAELRAQDGDADGALASAGAIVNAARSLGDEPRAMSQLVRVALRPIAVGSLERVLAQGEPSEAALAEVERLLEKEDGQPLLLIAARGERAGLDQMGQALQKGKLNLNALTRNADPPLSLLELASLYAPGGVKHQLAALLRYLTRYVETAKLPPEQQREEIARLDAAFGKQPYLVRAFTMGLGKVVEACRRTDAQLRCARVAVAAERYRLAHGRWPEALGALVEAGLLKAVPADPYDGAPLRLARKEDGLVIYALGPDNQDNGGTINRRRPIDPGTDLGFRLWDPAHRRQPPAGEPLAPGDER
jgi:hypothetical protein